MMMDRQMQQRVWQRVYGKPMPPKSQYNREKLQQCLRRAQMNFRYYDTLRMDPIYGAAFARLADDTMEHIKMLRQILGNQ